MIELLTLVTTGAVIYLVGIYTGSHAVRRPEVRRKFAQEVANNLWRAGLADEIAKRLSEQWGPPESR